MTNSADPDQLASSINLYLHCFQRQGISGLSRTRHNLSAVPFQTVHMKYQAFISLNNNNKKLECYLLQFLLGT